MIFKQYYLGCLSQASYLIGDTTTGRAVVVDPLRDIDQYVCDATANGLTIERVIETHFHADFLSGHLELAQLGALISYGDAAVGRAEFAIDPLAHGQRLSLGDVQLEVRATPGHTPESISIVVYEHPGAPPFGVLTGDTLFIGDVGRPDLLVSVGVTADELAECLYRSLHEQLMTLPDATKVYPAHGAGSACGKNLSTDTMSTIGEQRRTNYAVQPMSIEAFVEAVTQGQSVAPLYFSFAANRNREVHELLDTHEPLAMLDLGQVLEAQAAGAVVLDSRESNEFAAGHLRGALNVGLSGRFSEYTGEVVRAGTAIVLVGDAGTELEAKVRLGRIGFDDVIGALADPVGAMGKHPEHVVRTSRVTAAELASLRASLPGLTVVDVRNVGELDGGVVPGSVNIPLPQLINRMDELPREWPIVVHCAGGYRSSVATSLLEQAGFPDVSDLIGGYTAWAALVARV